MTPHPPAYQRTAVPTYPHTDVPTYRRTAVPTFRYRAARADGTILTGTVAAADVPHAGSLLAERGLFPIRIEPAPASVRVRSASRRELAIVFQSLASLVEAGVPLERAVGSTAPLVNGVLSGGLVEARRALIEGKPLSTALDQGDGIFPSVIVGMIRAGEESSRLGAALSEAARQLEQEAELVGRVRQALAYPAILAVVGTISIMVITVVVIPKFAAMLGDLGRELPPATRFLLDASQLVQSYWVLMVGAAVAVAAGWAVWIESPAGRWQLHRLLLLSPVIGPLRLAFATARVSRALGAMLGSGLPLLPALDAAGEAAADIAIAARLERARERVARGEPLTASLRIESAFSESALPLVEVGEASGGLAPMLRRAGDLAAAHAERQLHTLIGLLEPALIVVFGAVVALVAGALLQAVYSLRPGG